MLKPRKATKKVQEARRQAISSWRQNRPGPTVAHVHAPKMEAAIAERIGGYRTPGSGSKSEKGDVRIRNVIRLEAKCTAQETFRLTKEMIDKIERYALGANEIPAMEIAFLDKSGVQTHSVALVPTYVIDLLVSEKADVPPEEFVIEPAKVKCSRNPRSANAHTPATKLPKRLSTDGLKPLPPIKDGRLRPRFSKEDDLATGPGYFSH